MYIKAKTLNVPIEFCQWICQHYVKISSRWWRSWEFYVNNPCVTIGDRKRWIALKIYLIIFSVLLLLSPLTFFRCEMINDDSKSFNMKRMDIMNNLGVSYFILYSNEKKIKANQSYCPDNRHCRKLGSRQYIHWTLSVKFFLGNLYIKTLPGSNKLGNWFKWQWKISSTLQVFAICINQIKMSLVCIFS
jgi:hypothetical protein